MADRLILLVEDNPYDEALTLRALRKGQVNSQVVVAHDGVEALEYLFGGTERSTPRLSDVPDVVLLDLKMPRMDGFEVLRSMRDHDRTRLIPVVVFTSSNEEQDVMRSYAAGANSFVRKPIDFAEFTEATGTLGAFWTSFNVPPKEQREPDRQ